MPLYTIRHVLTRPDGTLDADAVAERAAKLAEQYGDAAHDAAMQTARFEAETNAWQARANELWAREQAERRAQAQVLADTMTLADLIDRRDIAQYGNAPYREEGLRVLNQAIEIKRGERKAEAA